MNDFSRTQRNHDNAEPAAPTWQDEMRRSLIEDLSACTAFQLEAFDNCEDDAARRLVIGAVVSGKQLGLAVASEAIEKMANDYAEFVVNRESNQIADITDVDNKLRASWGLS